MRPPRYATFCIGAYLISAKISPRRGAAHVGADSPRFMDPGCPSRLDSFRVIRDRIDITGELGGAELEAIRYQICLYAGVPLEEAGAPASRPASFSARERGQRFIDWRGKEVS